MGIQCNTRASCSVCLCMHRSVTLCLVLGLVLLFDKGKPVCSTKATRHLFEDENERKKTIRTRLELTDDPNPYDRVVYLAMMVGDTKFKVQIDTGSSDLGVPAQDCATCTAGESKRDVGYEPSDFAGKVTCMHPRHGGVHPKKGGYTKHLYTDTPICDKCSDSHQCQTQMSYIDGTSYKADIWEDMVTFENYDSKEAVSSLSVIGAIVKESGPFSFEPVGVDGILGAAYPLESNTGSITPVLAIADQNRMKRILSYCTTEREGSLTIGESRGAQSEHTKYTPLVKEGLFVVEIVEMFVGDHKVEASPYELNIGEPIFDTGNPDLSLPSKIYDLVEDAFKRACRDHKERDQDECEAIIEDLFDENCVKLYDSDFDFFPDIEMVFKGGESMIIKHHAYLSVDKSACQPKTPSKDSLAHKYEKSHEYYTLMLSSAEEVTIGAATMKGYNVIFDQENHRVGWKHVKRCLD